MGLYEVINDEERVLLENTSLGEWVIVEGVRVPLDFPLFEDEVLEETLEEAKKKKKKKDPPIGKPMRNSGGGKKYKVYVRNPKTGKIKTISYGDSKGGLKGGWNSAEVASRLLPDINVQRRKIAQRQATGVPSTQRLWTGRRKVLVMDFPFVEKKVGDRLFLREFREDVDSGVSLAPRQRRQGD